LKYPRYYTIDIASSCNLRCSFCPEGQRINPQPKRSMTAAEFKIFTRDIIKHAQLIGLTNWTEPFVNSDILEIVTYIKQKNSKIYVSLSTNGNSQKIGPQLISNLFNAGLDSIEITLSGIDQATYQIYHQGGKLQRVAETIYNIAHAKLRKGGNMPCIYLNFLTFPYNSASLKRIKSWLYGFLKDSDLMRTINYIRPIRGTIMGNVRNNQNSMRKFNTIWGGHIFQLNFRPRCNFIFEHFYLRADGKVFPCCLVEYNEKYYLGNIAQDNFELILQKREEFRSDFINGINSLCNRCTVLHGWLPLRNKAALYLNLRLLYLIFIHSLNKLDIALFGEAFFRKKWSKKLERL